ncbi:MAG: hypothetical protein SF339_02850 [Blastocatellia bacterium]|nr:hypothetical protein [Blastocatellia bacterium]
MYGSTKRELIIGFQYLLIGVIAHGVVLTWFNERPVKQKMLVWIAVALAVGVARVALLLLASTYKRTQWTSISRRNW